MAITLSIKQRIKGRWQFLQLADLSGKNLREVLQSVNNTDAVAEFILDDAKYYFCGTKYWLERMTTKGKVLTFEMLINKIERDAPQILDRPVPGLDLVDSIFGACALNTVHFEDSRPPGSN